MENLENVSGSTSTSGVSSTQGEQQGPSGPANGGDTFGGVGGWEKFKEQYPDVAKSMEENMAWTTIQEQQKSEERQKKMRQESERQQ